VQPHIVWIIFDEIDQRIAFSERPRGLQLPELDRIRGESLYATNAYPPGGATYLSLPSLLTGLSVTEAVPTSPSELSLTLAEGKDGRDGKDQRGTSSSELSLNVVGWSTLPTIFSQARALGVNTALVGWYHPYERLFGASLNYCSWYAYPMYEPSRASTFQATLLNSFWSTVIPLQRRRLHLKIYQHTFEDSLQVVTNSNFGLSLLHLPVPHEPGIYRPATGEFSITSFGTVHGYLDNLALADRTLGELRRAMETTGIWDKTWLLVSSDHWWRAAAAYDGKIDHRVPFILKPPGVVHSATYSAAFNTAITHDLLRAILRRELDDPERIVTWLDRHRTEPPSHYPNTRRGR